MPIWSWLENSATVFLTKISAAESTNIIASVSVLASVVALTYSWSAARSAKLALALAKSDHDERHTPMTSFMIDSLVWQDRFADNMFAMVCSLTNTANLPNTVGKLELIVHLLDAAGTASVLRLDPVEIDYVLPVHLSPLLLPINMNPRNGVAGWLAFRIPRDALRTKTVDLYELRGKDTAGHTIELVSHIPRRIHL